MILPPSPPSIGIGCLFVLYICTVLKRKEFCPIQVQVQCIDDAMLRHEREQKDAGQEDVEVAASRHDGTQPLPANQPTIGSAVTDRQTQSAQSAKRSVQKE